jgi:hypothetical protein
MLYTYRAHLSPISWASDARLREPLASLRSARASLLLSNHFAFSFAVHSRRFGRSGEVGLACASLGSSDGARPPEFPPDPPSGGRGRWRCAPLSIVAEGDSLNPGMCTVQSSFWAPYQHV